MQNNKVYYVRESLIVGSEQKIETMIAFTKESINFSNVEELNNCELYQ